MMKFILDEGTTVLFVIIEKTMVFSGFPSEARMYPLKQRTPFMLPLFIRTRFRTDSGALRRRLARVPLPACGRDDR
jgi:hypothetical protein